MSRTEATSFQFVWRDRAIRSDFRAGVSLHSHTMYSEESLDTIAHYTARVPYLNRAIGFEGAEFQRGREKLDFHHAFWTPPLSPRQACRLEERQIQAQFQLPALVSITDHDDIRAGSLLQVLDRFRHAPISTEWTLPFGTTFFHVGVHNIPQREANAIVKELAHFTVSPRDEKLAGILGMLRSYPDMLLVLNHPLMDEKGIGRRQHGQVLCRLLSRHGGSFDALEVNGLRCWKENQRVIRLAQQVGLPVISGGDRHGLEPNAILNLSQATTLAEFIDQVRYRRVSHVVFMPQYQWPLKLRLVRTIVDIVRDYPKSFGGRRTWTERVFFRDAKNAVPRPFSSICGDGGPSGLKRLIGALRLLGHADALLFSRLHERRHVEYARSGWATD
jgi:hypothetical protein